MRTTNGSEPPAGRDSQVLANPKAPSPSASNSIGTVLVLGSLRWTRVLVPRLDGLTYAKHEGWVGAPIVRDMIVESLIDPPAGPAGQESGRAWVDQARQALRKLIGPPSPGDGIAEAIKRQVGGITAVFKRFPQRSDPKSTYKVLRLEKNYVESVDSASSANALTEYFAETLNSADKDVDVFAVYDDDGSILGQLLDVVGASDGARRRSQHLIVASRGEIKADSISRTASRVGCGPGTTVIIATAWWLRRSGCNIVAYGSLEQTMKELVACAKSNSGTLRTLLDHSHHVVILFEETGLAYLRREEDELRGSFHFCPNLDDVAQFETPSYGRSPGQTALVLAAVVRQVASERTIGDLCPSLRLAVAASNLHFNSGFSAEDPFETARLVLSRDSREKLGESRGPSRTEDPDYLVASLTFSVDVESAGSWTRLGSWRKGRDGHAVREALRLLVRSGPEAVFRSSDVSRSASTTLWHPVSSITCPFLRLGTLKTFDAEEIQGYLALNKQIRAYLGKGRNTKPLSIAVFGSPGSGKSTAVKHLLESIRPGSSKNILTFNLSQFDSFSSLTEAFHRIQDRGLELSEPPLVMFDEFDCQLQGEDLGWLRYFLAPMQDGEFLGQSGRYRIGQAIFMFAGGTSATFEEFQERSREGVNKSSKLTDFVSRLLGFLNVRDINPSPKGCESEAEQFQRQVKRALTLEFQLREHMKDIVQGPSGKLRISDDVIDAFLDAPKYEHGIRSMEAIVRMSRPVAGEFVPASLPATALLEMHVRGFLRPQ